MTPTEIKIELFKRKITLTSIGKGLGVSEQAVHRVIGRNSTSERIMEKIADAIIYPKEQVFPEHEFKE